MRALSLHERAQLRAHTFVSLLRFISRDGRWWLVPPVIILGASSVLLSVVTAIEYVAPFVYSLF